MRRVKMIAVALLILIPILLAGCYTVLRHPTGGNVVAQGSTYRSCADCHADAAYYHPYYRYGRSHRGWGAYGGPVSYTHLTLPTN